jgi:hypothetical protein
LTIPDDTEKTDPDILMNCVSLKSLNIPKNARNIRKLNFAYSDLLEEINVDGDNPFYSDIKGILYNKEKNELIRCPQGVTGEITVPQGVTKINSEAFHDCSKITKIILPGSVRSIGKRAFIGCDGLTSINIPNRVKKIKEGSFRACSSLTDVKLPNNLTRIGGYAFYCCESLAEII